MGSIEENDGFESKKNPEPQTCSTSMITGFF